MSGLETLPPDQRAVLKLILEQGRGYAELAALLKIDPDAVRTRAHAGLDALAVPGAGELTPERRAQVADYLLGQQDEGERIVALAELGDSPAAVQWGHALRDRLTPLARDPLPELPAVAAGNGAATPPPEPAPASPPPAPPNPPAASTPAAAPAPRPGSSRLGGAILLGGVAVAVVVVAILLLTGGDDHKSTAASSTTPTTAQTQTTTTGSQASDNLVGAVKFKATPAGGEAFAVGLVQVQRDNTLKLALQAEKLPGNGTHDIYGVWIEGSGTGTKFLGYIPRQVKQNGTFAVNAPIPTTIRTGDTLLVTREPTTTNATPTQPGEAILSGPLRLK